MSHSPMEATVYKSRSQPDTYLFVPTDTDVEDVPAALLKMLGTLELVIKVELHEQRKLARADVKFVMSNLQTQGYYLQLPEQVSR